jgi:hypothetical protein
MSASSGANFGALLMLACLFQLPGYPPDMGSTRGISRDQPQSRFSVADAGSILVAAESHFKPHD